MSGVRPNRISALDGSTFAVSDDSGEITPSASEPLGLFFEDVRHLSRWELTVNGRGVDSLSTDSVNYDEATFFLVVPTGTIYRNPTLSITRRRRIANGMQEILTVENHATDTVRLELSIQFDADFADIFAVKNQQHDDKGRRHKRVGDDEVRLTYSRGTFERTTRVCARDAYLTDESLTYRLELAPHERLDTTIELRMATGSHEHEIKQRRTPNIDRTLEEWLDAAPQLKCDSDSLRHTYERSLVDLAALRFYPSGMPAGASLPAAGLPWFMALFGRDSLITSYQALPFVPELARTTLRALAARQAAESDDFRDAAPGKILHELRHGEQVYFHEAPQSPYYGSADVTPLFLVVLDEYERWSGDVETVRDLEGPARAAVGWIDEYGDFDSDGFVEYETRNPHSGLVNQCWKDSSNSIVHPDGTLASLPRATCEIQGYVYDAKLRTARLARTCWGDGDWADRLEAEAGELRRRFHDYYWVADGHYYALALDGDKQQVRTITSNIGQLLWSGIVPEERVDDLVGHLFGSGLWSGWGIRTLAAGQPVYNPIEYHNGTVWPHDNALIAAGLLRYGRRDEAARIAEAVLDAAAWFDHRLPEVFAGFDRSETRFPVRYPTACSPQAWATGTPLLLIRALLGLDPRHDQLCADPHVPERLGRIGLDRVPGRWGRVGVSSL